MKLIPLKLQARNLTGSKDCGRLRRSNFIPGIAYRNGQNWLIQAKNDYIINLFKKTTTAQIFQIETDIEELNGKLALVKEVQMDYVTRTPLHFDLQIVLESDKIEVEVPLRFVGDAIGVKNSGGVLSIVKHELLVKCSPLNIPDEILVDVSDLDVGDSLHVGDVKLPEGIEHRENLDDPLVSVVKETEEESEGESPSTQVE